MIERGDPADAPAIPAGSFADWLRDTRRALSSTGTGAGIDVPCGDCTACCTSSYFIHIEPGESCALERAGEDAVPAPGRPKGHRLMGFDAEGRCPKLAPAEGACTIYPDRPQTCRRYDCRVFAAAGISAGGDKPRINARVERWTFAYPAPRDREEHEAVRAAARFIREHGDLFPGGRIPDSPSPLAVLAIKVYAVFLEGDGLKSGRTDKETAAAIVEAARVFDTGAVGA